MTRKIIHIDMDAFYASVEQMDNPELRNKPIAIGKSNSRGVVATASYEARKYGIHSAMSSVTAIQKCPELIFVPARFQRYKELSLQIRSIFYEYTPLVEPLSLDEAYLDVTAPIKGQPSATLIAKEIQQRVKDEIGLTCSAGVSYNKFLAKIASDINKPFGICIIDPPKAESFLERLKIEKFHGIGKATAKKLHHIGVYYGKDLKKLSLEHLTTLLGKNGAYFYDIVRGIDTREVQPHREPKSVGIERTLSHDVYSLEEMNIILKELTKQLITRIKKQKKRSRTLILKIKYNNYKQITRSHTEDHKIETFEEIFAISSALLSQNYNANKGVRLLGISMHLEEPPKFTPFQLKIDFDY